MVKINTYDSQSVVQRAQVSAPVVNAPNRELQQVSRETLQGLGKVAKAFFDMRNVKESTAAETNNKVALAQLQDEALNERDTTRLDEYQARRAEIVEDNLSAISHEGTRERARQAFTLDAEMAGIHIQRAFRETERQQGRVVRVTSLQVGGDIYRNTSPTPAGAITRKREKAGALAKIKDGVAIGEISPQEGEKLTNNIIQNWEYDRAIADAEKGIPINISDYEVPSGKRDDLSREIKQIAQIQTNMEDMAHLQAQAKNQKEFIDQQEQGMSIEESLKKLDYGLATGTMDEGWAKSKRAAVLSVAGVDPEMQVETFYTIVQKINRASAKYNIKGGGKTGRNMIKEANEALIMINEGRAAGTLDSGDEAALLKRIYTKETAEAEHDGGKKLRNATAHFESTLTPAEVPYAVRDYLQRFGQKKELKGEELQKDVVESIQKASRKAAQEVLLMKKRQDQVTNKDTKMINGVKYQKVEGGWLPAQ